MKKTKNIKKKTLNPNYFYLLVFCLSFLLYGNTLKNDYAVDDGIYISNHADVQKGIKGIGEIFSHGSTYAFNQIGGLQPYRPVTLFSFAIGKSLFNNVPSMEHFINIFLYALIGIFLFRLLGFWLQGFDIVVQIGIVTLFLVHPIHTEVVANIKSRDEILCLLFAILSLFYLNKFIRSGKTIGLVWSSFFFGMSLLSKENGITLLGIIPLSLYFFEKIPLKKIIQYLVSFIAVAAVYLIIRNRVIGSVSAEEYKDILNNVLIGAENLGQRTATLFSILGKYLQLLIFPYPLSSDYSFNQIPIVSWSDFSAILSVLLHAGLIVFAFLKLKSKNIFAFCILFYFTTLSVVSNVFFLNGATLAERFLFMPSVAFSIALPVFLTQTLKINLGNMAGKNKTVWWTAMVIICLTGTMLTISRNKDWKNNFTLFEADVTAAPNSSRIHTSFAYECKLKAFKTPDVQLRQSLLQKAEDEFQASLNIYPKNHIALYNLGVMYYEIGLTEKAKGIYLKTLAMIPDYLEVLNNLGVIYFHEQNYEEAKKCFEKVLVKNPDHENALLNVGAVYHNQHDFKKAIIYYEKTLALYPGNATVYDNLIKAYYSIGDSSKAEFYKQQMAQNIR